MKTETNKIGFIGGMNVPLLHRFEAGYRAGAAAINPQTEVLVDYMGVTPDAFNDPAKGKELALAQYNKGVDIIIAAAGATSLGILEAAKEKQKYIIWVDSNGNHLAPGAGTDKHNQRGRTCHLPNDSGISLQMTK
jgi:basic membrane protein A